MGRSDDIDIESGLANKQTGRTTGRETGRQTGRQAGRQTDKTDKQHKQGRQTVGLVGKIVKTHLAGLPGADVHPSKSYRRQLQPAVVQIGFPHRR